MCHYIVESGKVLQVLSCFFKIKKVCALQVHIRVNNIHNQTESTLLNVLI